MQTRANNQKLRNQHLLHFPSFTQEGCNARSLFAIAETVKPQVHRFGNTRNIVVEMKRVHGEGRGRGATVIGGLRWEREEEDSLSAKDVVKENAVVGTDEKLTGSDGVDEDVDGVSERRVKFHHDLGELSEMGESTVGLV